MVKKSKRLFISGAVQPIFFNRFVKDNADRLGVRGFIRNLEDGRAEIFIEGDLDAVDKMSSLCKRGPQHSQLRKVEEKDERFQDFKEFRIIKF